jgi:hypothetical protein
MIKVNYALIGTVDGAEQFREILPLMITAYQLKTETLFEYCPLQDRLDLSILASQIEDCAKHFYGLDPEDFNTMDDLIDAIHGLDQQLEFA